MRTVNCLIPLLVLVAVAAPVSAQQGKNLTLDKYLDWERVSDPQISPDGAQIVYTRRWVDKMKDRWASAIWMMNANGTRNRFLTEGSSPRWSPDGTRISFVREGEPKGSQIFVRWMDAEGATTQITRVERSPGSVTWSPDGTKLAFTMAVAVRDTWNIRLPKRPKDAEWTGNPKIVTRLNYRRDRRGYVDDSYTHLFVVDAEGGTPRQLTDGNWSHRGVAWKPDGGEILFSSLRTKGAEHEWRESEIYAVNLESGEIRQLTNRRGPDGSPVVSPDGKLVAYTGYDWTDDTYITSKLYVMGLDGSNPREIAAGLDRQPRGLIWSGDSRGLYFNVSEHGTTNLYLATLRGKAKQITDGNQRLVISSISRSGTAVGTLTSYYEPGDVVAFDLKKPAPKKLTHVNADVLARTKLGEVEEVDYTSLDGFKIQGWIIKPPDFDPAKKYPLILAIHGGPHGMYGVGFNFGWQDHAANGYVVLYTNPRGSSGYGSAFGNAIKRAYPGKDFNDLMAGVDTVINRGYIDTDNLFVYGCSGGGVLTSWVVGHTKRFRAASANCPVTNWISFVGTTDGAGWYRNFDSLPWDDPAEYLRRSPLMYVGNVATPTMLMTGVNDLRTPMGQTEEYYRALRYLKVPTAMIRFKNEWHGTGRRPSNFMRTQLYLRSWFERWKVKKGEPDAVSEGSR